MLGIGDIVRIFEEIEQRLVRSLKRNLMRHKDEEKRYDKNWTAWQAEKLRSLEGFRRENAAMISEYTDQIDSATREIMQEEFDQGVNGGDAPEAVPIGGTPAEVKPEPQFFGVDTTKVNKLIEDVTAIEKNAETAALRMTDDVYRTTVNRVQLAMSTGSMTLQQAIDTAVKDFLDQGINCIVYKDGRRVHIADYVRMVLRTSSTRAALQGKSEKYKALGFDTVAVSSYGMCSPTCLPYQGRVYINDAFTDWSGETETRADGMVWGKSNYCGKWFPLLSSAIKGGLFHPNCRHSITLWRDGDPLPKQVDNTETERRYKLEQEQRALERAVRKAKRRAEGFTDPANIRKAKDELKEAQKKLREFIKEHEDVLRRDAGREKVYEGEIANNHPLDNSGKSGIIEEKEELPRKMKSGSNAVDWSIVQSEEYSKKFTKLSTDEKVSSAIETRAKWALNNRDGKSTEELYAISLKDGREVSRITDQNYNSAVKRTPKFTRKLNTADESGEQILLLHNHPRGLPPSIYDINALLKNKNVSGITVGHNGSIYRYTRPNKEIPSDEWNIAMKHFKEFSEPTAMEKSLEILSQKYGFIFERI